MKAIGLDHVTINCSNREAAFEFYEKVMGFSFLNHIDMGDHELFYYAFPASNTRLELISYKNPQKCVEAGNTDVGMYRHMAIVVDDLDAYFKACKDFGCKINLEPVYAPLLGKTVMLVVDPNGVEIELIQAE